MTQTRRVRHFHPPILGTDTPAVYYIPSKTIPAASGASRGRASRCPSWIRRTLWQYLRPYHTFFDICFCFDSGPLNGGPRTCVCQET